MTYLERRDNLKNKIQFGSLITVYSIAQKNKINKDNTKKNLNKKK